MMQSHHSRNEEAVSAAVATVMLFGGVLSIIGLMLLTIIPVIQELEGSIERHDMEAQMLILSDEINQLSEQGLPGDKKVVELSTLDGEISWDQLRGGMWYSASWVEGHSLRLDGILDFDDFIKIRHPTTRVHCVCMDDMRLGPENHFFYSHLDLFDQIVVTPMPQLTIPLGPVSYEMDGQSFEIKLGETKLINNPTKISSDHELLIMGYKGESGATHIPPIDPNPLSGLGRTWQIPITSGEQTLHFVSPGHSKLTWSVGNQDFSQVILNPEHPLEVASWTQIINATEPGLATLTSSGEGSLLLVKGTQGMTNIVGLDNAYLSQSFIPPQLDGKLSIYNPSQDGVNLNWRLGGVSVPGNSSLTIDWPPLDREQALIVSSSSPVAMRWHQGNDGILQNIALDTGQLSGQEYTLSQNGTYTMQLLGEQLFWVNETTSGWNNDSESTTSFVHQGDLEHLQIAEGDSSRMIFESGANGIMMIERDGENRCISLNISASGWIEVEAPWQDVRGRGEADIIRSWRDGSHFSGMAITLFADTENAPYGAVSNGWAFHLSRLSYEFTSSISGLEVAWSGGAVVTNHPELEPVVLRVPAERGGPGPRFSATIPSLYPVAQGTTGQGYFNGEIELTSRKSLASYGAYEVRRGWYGPYGEQLGDVSASALASSEDWTAFPGQLSLLTDYAGWVPVPSQAAAETVWHTGGEQILFTLQSADLSMLISEAT